MLPYIAITLFIYTFRINFLIILDVMEVALTGLFAGVLAVIITLGKNETCKSLERYSADYNWQ